MFVFFKQKTAYELRISDWSSDVCSSDLDHADDADRFIGDDARGIFFGEAEILERGDRAHEAADAGADLRSAREADRRAHFDRHRPGEIGSALLILLDDPGQNLEQMIARGQRPALERILRRGDRSEAHTSDIQSL